MDEQAKFRLWLLFRARKPRYRVELKKRSASTPKEMELNTLKAEVKKELMAELKEELKKEIKREIRNQTTSTGPGELELPYYD